MSRSAWASRSIPAAAWRGEKIQEAQSALDRFVFELLDKQDEIFLYRFSNYPTLLQGWTTRSPRCCRARSAASSPNGGTAMCDAIAEAIPLAQQGQNRKKALLRDFRRQRYGQPHRHPATVKQLIRESEVLVYAIGIDGESASTAQRTPPPRAPLPMPFPFPGAAAAAGSELAASSRRRRRWMEAAGRATRNDDRVNVVALRDMTDDSGGRTEIVRDARDLNPATASIADELSKQYYLGYPVARKKDGRWHSIRVEVSNRAIASAHAAGYVAARAVRRSVAPSAYRIEPAIECRVPVARDRARPEPPR